MYAADAYQTPLPGILTMWPLWSPSQSPPPPPQRPVIKEQDDQTFVGMQKKYIKIRNDTSPVFHHFLISAQKLHPHT